MLTDRDRVMLRKWALAHPGLELEAAIDDAIIDLSLDEEDRYDVEEIILQAWSDI